MPKIQWEKLPREKWAHLRDRAKERKVSPEDLFNAAQVRIRVFSHRPAPAFQEKPGQHRGQRSFQRPAAGFTYEEAST
jgi:hypothetical protein